MLYNSYGDIMKKIIIFIIVLFISGCSVNNTKVQEDNLQLNNNRVMVSKGSEIDYLSYITCNNKDEVKYNQINNNKVGTYNVEYSYNGKKQTLIVDVVKMYKNNIYSPVGIKAKVVSNPDDITVLINKVNEIPKDYKPKDLVKVIDSSQMLRKEAANAYKKFYQAAKKRNIEIYSISGYRTNKTQTLYWNNQCKVHGEEYASQYSAYPLRSEHQLGLALDISYKTSGDRLSESVEDSDIGKFIVSDGYKYGFILRYPKDKVSITNYGYEPWHIRYVGKDLALELHNKGITLDEYYK